MKPASFDPFEIAASANNSKLDSVYNDAITPLAGYTHKKSIPVDKLKILEHIIVHTLPDFSMVRPALVWWTIKRDWTDPLLPSGYYRIPATLIPRGQAVQDVYGINCGNNLSMMLGGGWSGDGDFFGEYMDEVDENIRGAVVNAFFEEPDIVWTAPPMPGISEIAILMGLRHAPDLSTMHHTMLYEFKKLARYDILGLLKPYYHDVMIKSPYGEIPLSDSELFSGLSEKRETFMDTLTSTTVSNVSELMAINS